MIRKALFTIFLCVLFPILSPAERISFTYDADFEMKFDNREYYSSSFSNSMTIFGSRLTPSFGIDISSDAGMRHSLMAGIDVMKDFGASPVKESISGEGSAESLLSQNNKDLLRELIIYYGLQRKSDESSFSLYAGIFPRSLSEGDWSQAFFSDSLRFYDNNLEGILLKYRREQSYVELGCDWMGQYGDSRREKFMVFSAGNFKVAPFMSLGYSAYMYHFAGSRIAKGVVDNILLNPHVDVDFTPWMKIQKFSMRFGWLQSFQHDRVQVGNYVYPAGGEFDVEVRNWNFGLRNYLFCGTDMMPYYDSPDVAGHKYGTRLYFGDPFYRVHDDGRTGPGIYDRLEAMYETRVAKGLDVRIAAIFHFHDFGYSGCQQQVTLSFDLERMMNK